MSLVEYASVYYYLLAGTAAAVAIYITFSRSKDNPNKDEQNKGE